MDLNAAALAAWLNDYAAEIAANHPMLTDLDIAIGDGDHGTNMHRGMQAVAALDAADFADARGYAKQVAMTLISTIGGASGPLYGTFMLRLAAALPDDGPIDKSGWLAALEAGVEGIRARGKATSGDKTMLDALEPALAAFEAAESEPWQAASVAADAGRDATIPLVARKGRASYLGERSAGHADPGATSAALLIAAAARTLA